jgi:predicted TIM-barrel fold metal-dependent hydrolase
VGLERVRSVGVDVFEFTFPQVALWTVKELAVASASRPVGDPMKRFKWMNLGRKSAPESPYEPPIWLGNRSNGEFYEPQTARDRLVRKLILERADENARRVGLERREFLASAMGMATSLWALNIAGCSTSNGTRSGDRAPGDGGYQLPKDAQLDDAAACSVLTGNEFIFDGHTHHFDPNGEWRSGGAYEGAYQGLFDSTVAGQFPDKQMRPCGGPASLDCLTRDVYIREFFTESDTTMTVLTMWPSIPCTASTSPDCGLLITHRELAITRDIINRLSHSQRCLTHVGVMPAFDLDVMSAMMEEAVAQGEISGWKSYTGIGPGVLQGQTKGYRLTDDTGKAFIEKGLSLAIPIFCLHKGLPSPSYDAATNDSEDVGPAAKAYPNAKFVVFHANLNGGVVAPGATRMPEGPYDPANPNPLGVDILVRSLLDAGVGPNENVYADLGTTWSFVSNDPTQAAHVIGKLLKYAGENNLFWGSDALPSEHAQSQIEKFRAFQIPDALQQAHGYPALTPELKAKIFGLNLAALYGIDPNARRCVITKDDLSMARRALDDEFGSRRFTQKQPLGPRTRREFLAFLKANGGMPG